MKNILSLENYGVAPMTKQEMKFIDGGFDPNGCAGCAAGTAFRNWLINSVRSMASGMRKSHGGFRW